MAQRDNRTKPPATRGGAILRSVNKDLKALELAGPIDNTLADTARQLARELDNGAGMSAAAIARELRVTMEKVAVVEEGPAETDPILVILQRLSTPS